MVITQSGAQNGNGPGQYFVSDGRAVPDFADQVITLDYLVLVLSKVDENFHDFGFQVRLAVFTFQ